MIKPELPTSTSGKTAQDVAITAAKMAADIILRDVERAKHLTYRDIATDTDIAAEKAIIDLLSRISRPQPAGRRIWQTRPT